MKGCSYKCVKWTGAWKGHDQEWGMQGVVSPRESTEREQRRVWAAWTPYTEQEGEEEKVGKEAEKRCMDKLENAANAVLQTKKGIQEEGIEV